ncbi:MAG: fimbrillin family protein, partial [Bacteroidales bacterium]|nr:fimbrillin family protein [Bacteroidales bacterium]
KSNTSYGSKVTTSSYTSAGWVNSPAIYWENGFTDYYFRGLALYSGSSISSVDGSLVASKGKDLVWATTPEHVGKESDNTEHPYQKGQAINPRTSEVPLEFEHIMSQVSVKLATDATNVPIEGAKMYVTGLYDNGTVNIDNGSIASLSASGPLAVNGLLSSDAESGSKFSNILMIPQSLVNDKDGNERTAKTTLYLREDLTDIYSDGTSVSDGGSSETYVTATLDKVLYTQGEADSFNAALPGHISVTDIKTPAEYYSEQEADAFNASNMIPDSYGRNPGDEDYEVTYPSDYTPVQEGDEKTPAVYYTEEEVRTHNESLNGAIHEGDFKCYRTNASSVQKNIGDVKSIASDSKIVLSIILTDGTTYSIALSDCVVSGTDGKITEWERGKNYTYTIILSKEEIKFLALVKDWETTTGSGNANLDWD